MFPTKNFIVLKNKNDKKAKSNSNAITGKKKNLLSVFIIKLIKMPKLKGKFRSLLRKQMFSSQT
jgi:hypothetical protein